jgi:hypothetical protein
MPRRQGIESVLRRKLGKAAADRLLDTIERMVAKRARAAEIERVVTKELEGQLETQVATAIEQVSADPHVSARAIQAVRPIDQPAGWRPQEVAGPRVRRWP